MLREIVDHVNVGIVIVGSDFKVRLWNRWMENVSGVDSFLACTLTLGELMPSLGLSGLEEKIHDALHLERETKCRLQGESQVPWAADLEVTIQPMASQYHLHSLTPRSGNAQRRCLIQFRNAGTAIRFQAGPIQTASSPASAPTPTPTRAFVPHVGSGITGRHVLEQHKTVQRPRILLADDNPITRGMIRKVLLAEGFELKEVANGHEAIRIVQLASCFDLILMDVCMPLMDGLEASSQIRALVGAKGAVPIIALSANASTLNREKFCNAGVDDFLVKPIHTSALVEKCRMHLESKGPPKLTGWENSNV